MSKERSIRFLTVVTLVLSLVTTSIPIPVLGASTPPDESQTVLAPEPAADGKVVLGSSIATDDLLTLFGVGSDVTPEGSVLSSAAGSSPAWAGTYSELSTSECIFKPVQVTGFNADIIAEGSIFDRDPFGSLSTQSQATTNMSLEPEGSAIQSTFVAAGFRGRADDDEAVPFDQMEAGEASRMLPRDGRIIYKMEGTGFANTLFQLEPYDAFNAFAIKENTTTAAEVNFVNAAGYQRLHLLTAGVPVQMNTFQIVFADGSAVSIDGGYDFGGSSHFASNGNHDGGSVSFVLAARNDFENGNMERTKATFDDTSAPISKYSDQMIDPEQDGLYYHYLTGRSIDLTNIAYSEAGEHKVGDLSGRPIKKLIFADANFAAGEFVDYRAGFLLAVSGLVTPTPARPNWSLDMNSSSYYFDLNWADVNDETEYILEVALDNGFTNFVPGFQAKEIAQDSTTAKVTGLEPNTTYYCRLTGYNQELPGIASEVKAVTTAGEDGTFRVLYDLNGVSVLTPVVDDKKYYNGDETEVLDGPPGTYIRTSDSAPVEFVSWNTQSDGSGEVYVTPDAILVGGGNTTLYAQWTLAGQPEGSGTAADPYVLEDSGNLLWMSFRCRQPDWSRGKHFLQNNDIDLAGVNWIPIKDFGGHYDGGGFRIKNMTMRYDRAAADAAGMSRFYSQMIEFYADEQYRPDESDRFNYRNVLLNRYAFGMFESIDYFDDGGKGTYLGATLENIHLMGLAIDVDFNSADPNLYLEELSGIPALSVPVVAVGGLVAAAGCGSIYEYRIADWAKLSIRNCSIDATSTIAVKAPNALVGGFMGYAYFKNDNYQRHQYAENLLVFTGNASGAQIQVESRSGLVSKKTPEGETSAYASSADLTAPHKNVFEPTLTVGGLIGDLRINSADGDSDRVANNCATGDITVHAGSKVTANSLAYYSDNTVYTDPGIADKMAQKQYAAPVAHGLKRVDERLMYAISGLTKVGGLFGSLDLEATTYTKIYNSKPTVPTPPWPQDTSMGADFHSMYYAGNVTVDRGVAGNSSDRMLLAGSFIGAVRRLPMVAHEFQDGALFPYANLEHNFFVSGSTANNSQISPIGHSYQPPDCARVDGATEEYPDTSYYYPGSDRFAEKFNYIMIDFKADDQSIDGNEDVAGRFETVDEVWLKDHSVNKLDEVWNPVYWAFPDGQYPQLKQSFFDLESVEVQTYDAGTSTSQAIAVDPENPGQRKLVMNPADSQDLILIATPPGDSFGDVKWTSDNPNVAVVSSAMTDRFATLISVNPGTATLTALTQKGGLVDRVTVQVSGVDVSGIAISYQDSEGNEQDEMTLEVGASTTPGKLTAAISPVDAFNQGFRWESSDPEIASVAADGVVTLHKYGRAFIYAFSDDGFLYDRIKVNAIPLMADSLAIDRDEIALNATYNSNPTERIAATAARSDGRPVSITKFKWESSDDRVATVSQNGVVYAVGIGTATITVSTADGSSLSKTCRVTVTGAHVQGVAPRYAGDVNKELEAGEKVLLPVTVSPPEALCKDVIWSSSNPEIIAVTANGWVTPKASAEIGDVTITATTVDGGFSAAFQPKVTVGERKIQIANKGRFFKMTLDKVRQMETAVYPLNTDYPEVTYSSSRPEVATVSASGLVRTLALGTTVITVKTKHKGLTESMVLNVVENSRATVVLKDKHTNAAIAGAVISIDGDSFTTGGDGSAMVSYAPDEPTTFFEIKKDGYRTKMYTLSEFSSGNLTVFMEPDDGTPYFEYIGKISKAGLIANLGEGYVSSSIKEISTVHIWIDWKETAEGDVFLSKGSKQFRGVPVMTGFYKVKERCFYADTRGETGLFYANLYPAATEVVPRPQAANSRQITWEFIDFDKQYGDIGMSNSEVDFAGTGQSNMFDTGFFMGLPENCPVQIEVDGTDVKITIAYSTGMENGGDGGGWSKSEDEPGGDVDEMEDDELLDSIKESIVSGAMSDKLKELTDPPTNNKLERRMEVSIELFGYVEGTLVQKPMFVNLASTDQAMAEQLGIDPVMMNALKNLGVPSIPLSIVSMEINSAGLQVTADGKVTFSQQFYPGGIPIYVELVIGASLEQVLKFQIMGDGGMDFAGSTQVKPYLGCYGALGIGKLLSIGPTLNGQLPITITYPDPVEFDISLAMQFGLRIKFLFWSKNFRFYDREWTLFNSSHRRTASMGMQAFSSLAETDPKIEGFEPLPRDYTAQGYADDTAVNQVISSVRNISDLRMTSGYPELMPTLVCLEGDRQMLFWVDDDLTRSLENRTVLVYSLSDDAGKTWSAPAVIDNDGTADGNYSVAVDENQHVYVAFQSAAKALSPAATLQEFTGLMQIKAAVFDGTDFTTPVVVSDLTRPLAGDYVYEANVLPKVVLGGEEVSVLWLTNTANDILGLTGENVIRRASCEHGAFSQYETLHSTASPLLDYTAVYHGGELEIAYLSDEDMQPTTMEDRSLYLLDDAGNSTQVRIGAYLDKPILTKVNGKTALYWYEDQNIRYLPDIGILADVREVFAQTNASFSPATADFQVVTKDDRSMLLYSAGAAVSELYGDQEEIRPVKNIMAAFYDGEQQAWGGFSTDLTQHDQDVNYYSADLDANGDVHLAISERLALGDFAEAARLKVFNIKPSVDLAVADGRIYYNESNVVQGTTSLPIAAYVENRGQVAARGIVLELYVSDTLVASHDYPDAIIVPGEASRRFTVDYPLSAPLREDEVKLVVKPAETADANPDDNQASTYVGCGDLVLGKIKNATSSNTFVSSFKVVNYSYKRLDDVVAKVYATDADGRKLGEAVQTVVIGSLDAYQDKGAAVEMDLAVVDFAGAFVKTYLIELSTPDTHEVVTVNNTGYFSIPNPNREMIPFDVSISRVIMKEDSLCFSVNAANLTATPNTGDLEIQIYAEPADDSTAPTLLKTVTRNALSVPAGRSVEEVVSIDNDGSLEGAYMVTARFISGAGGIASGGVTHYSNLAFDTIADLIPSGNNYLSELIVDGAAIGFAKTTSDYRVPVAPNTKTKLKATAEDEISSLISYHLNGDAPYYAVSGEETNELTVRPGDVLRLLVKAEDGSVRQYRIDFVSLSGSDDGGGTVSGPAPSKPTPVPVLVNGKSVEAAEKSVGSLNGETLVVVTLIDEAIRAQLAAEGRGSVVTVPVSEEAGTVRTGLNMQILEEMSREEAVLELTTNNVTYTLPTGLLDLDAVSAAIGEQVALEDIDVTISIATPAEEVVRVVQNSADQRRVQLVVPPIEFTITCTSADRTVEVTQFRAYVERIIAIPAGVDPSQVTTAVVLQEDGSFRHVPTRVMAIDGRYYAQVNSLTNSVYAVIWNPTEFRDAANHWAKGAINDIGSRLIMDADSDGFFGAKRLITREEFAATIVKALGLQPSNGSNPFVDIAPGDRYYGYMLAAYEHRIMSGYPGNRFDPKRLISREEAMSMIVAAMRVTKLQVSLTEDEATALLQGYVDHTSVGTWARGVVTTCLKSGILGGRPGALIAPKDQITRAEVAEVIQRLLRQSKLI